MSGTRLWRNAAVTPNPTSILLYRSTRASTTSASATTRSWLLTAWRRDALQHQTGRERVRGACALGRHSAVDRRRPPYELPSSAWKSPEFLSRSPAK